MQSDKKNTAQFDSKESALCCALLHPQLHSGTQWGRKMEKSLLCLEQQHYFWQGETSTQQSESKSELFWGR